MPLIVLNIATSLIDNQKTPVLQNYDFQDLIELIFSKVKPVILEIKLTSLFSFSMFLTVSTLVCMTPSAIPRSIPS